MREAHTRCHGEETTARLGASTMTEVGTQLRHECLAQGGLGTLAVTAPAPAMGAAVGTAEPSTGHRTRRQGNLATREARWRPLVEQSRVAADAGAAGGAAGVAVGVGAGAAACTAARGSSLEDGTCVRPAVGKHFAATARHCSGNAAFSQTVLRWRALGKSLGTVQTPVGRSSVLDPQDPGNRRSFRGLGAVHEGHDRQEYGHSLRTDDQNRPTTIPAGTGPSERRIERWTPPRPPIQTRSLWRCPQLTESS